MNSPGLQAGDQKAGAIHKCNIVENGYLRVTGDVHNVYFGLCNAVRIHLARKFYQKNPVLLDIEYR